MKFALLADQEPVVEALAPWLNAGASSIIGGLLAFIIMKWLPKLIAEFADANSAMLLRHDEVQKDTRDHFERILDKIELNRQRENEIRSAAAKDGHDVAKTLSGAVDRNSEALRDLSNTLSRQN